MAEQKDPSQLVEAATTETTKDLSKLHIDATTSLATLSIHADDYLNGPNITDVAPALHVSTTYRYTSDLRKLRPVADEDLDPTGDKWVYSRLASPNLTRFEALLTAILKAPSLAYSSGLASFFALLTQLKPKVIAISEGYHGCHSIIAIHNKLYGLKKVSLHNVEEWDAAGLGEGDLVHVESPLNPTGEAYNIAKFVALAHARGAKVSVDATFGPPPLQDPFVQGVDVVMHSGTKYIGGHSDLLCGILAVKDETMYKNLWAERMFLGSVMGNLENWLGVRSLRTLEIRVERQSSNATKLATWIHGCLSGEEGHKGAEIVKKMVAGVQHASIQALDADTNVWLQKQMPNGYGPVFAIKMKDQETARALPTKLKYFHHATSLGGVESLVEWRRMTDPGVDPRILRISVGIESWEDLQSDLLQAFESLA